MCGIAAIYNFSGGGVDVKALARMSAHMASRGPDGAGEWLSPDRSVALAHRRLAIIDLTPAGTQPMTSHDGTVRVTFNGEIYNHQALRAQMQARGCVFKSNSDTEVLLHMYQAFGEKMLPQLRGMFAFAIWDGEKKGLLLARDHFGIKPLYYSVGPRGISVASQVKALKAGGGIDLAPEPAGHVGYFLWGHVPEPYTLYKGIRALPAGSSVWVNAAGIGRIKTYCDITGVYSSAGRPGGEPPPPEEVKNEVREALRDSVANHLIADVPVGVFLSGGLDSTTLAALATEGGRQLNSVTLGFEEFRGTRQDETHLAELVAQRYGAEHKTVWITREMFCNAFERLLESMDMPTIDGVNSYFISAAAKEVGLKVVMSGVGADELFGGYSTFREVPRLVGAAQPFCGLPSLGRLLRKIIAPLCGTILSPKYASILEYGCSFEAAYFLRQCLHLPWELAECLPPDLIADGLAELEIPPPKSAVATTSSHLKISGLVSKYYLRNQLLRDCDWASMSHSLEVRTPFVDIQLVSRVAALIGRGAPVTKYDMAAAARPQLPQEILLRPKTGFAIPVREWLMRAPATSSTGKWEGRTPNRAERGLRGWSKEVYKHYRPEDSAAMKF